MISRADFASMLRRNRGVTLVELIMFIIIIGVVAVALMSGLASTVRGTGLPKQMNIALQLAQERMELIRARKDVVGFAAFTAGNYDPCALSPMPVPAHPACTVPPLPNYNVTPCFYTAAGICGTKPPCFGGDVNYKCVLVTVTGPDGTQLAELSTMVADY
jgi:type II secretory pathway pseudopilin PulG